MVRAGLSFLTLVALGITAASPGAAVGPEPQKPQKLQMPNLEVVKPPALKLRPEDVRLRTDPTAWWWYHGVSASFIGQKLKEHGARIVDLEIERASPDRFSVVMVKNEGTYAARWWWYYGLRGVGAVASKVNGHENARLIDLERIEVRSGKGVEPRFAIVLVDNSGPHERLWRRHFNDPLDSIRSNIETSGLRLVDLEDHRSSAAPGRWGAVLLENDGSDARSWWWYLNVSPDFIARTLSRHGARLIDIEPAGDGKFHVVMVERTGEAWWWYYGLSADALAQRLRRNRARLIDLEPYRVGGQKRFAAVMVEN